MATKRVDVLNWIFSVIFMFLKLLLCGHTYTGNKTRTCIKHESDYSKIIVDKLYSLPLNHLYVYALILGPIDIPQTSYDYSIYYYRLASFRNWPRDHPVFASHLAGNGLFYVDSNVPDTDNFVMCHACFQTISISLNDIVEVHRINSPDCPFLSRLEELNEVTREESSASIHEALAQEIRVEEPSWISTFNTEPNSNRNHQALITLPLPTNSESLHISGPVSSLAVDGQPANSSANSQTNNSPSVSGVTVSRSMQMNNVQPATSATAETQDAHQDIGHDMRTDA
uniref:Uncharacterized protein n=1 Tax=Biomphalaria glabrata TaxID=6526 RepID=A0A2C9KL17_BIOGL